MKLRIPFDKVNWTTSIFLMGTLLLSLTLVPWYLIKYGMNAFMFKWFIFYVFATGLSITLGYHRLFSHLSFKAKWPVKLFVLLFGAASFENSALDWSSDHRRHHKHVDHDDDPYNINQGFFFAHIGWLLFKLKPEPPLDNVADLQKDKLVMLQHSCVQSLGIFIGFILPFIIGYLHGGWIQALGFFLTVGVLRVVLVQHSTFCINSFCHYIGRQPYSTRCSAKDSAIMALFTFGEGYHNYHHEFQHDYRNGVKPWQFDPTKWMIWLLSKVGLTSNLRRVPDSKIYVAEMTELHRQIEKGLSTYTEDSLPAATWKHIESYAHALQALSQKIMERCKALQVETQEKLTDISQEMMHEFRNDARLAKEYLTELKRACEVYLPKTE